MSMDLCLELKLPLIPIHINSKYCLKSKANKRTNKESVASPLFRKLQIRGNPGTRMCSIVESKAKYLGKNAYSDKRETKHQGLVRN